MAKKGDKKLPGEQVFPAPFWKRILAYFVDLFVINFIIVMPFRHLFTAAQSESTFSGLRQQLISPPASGDMLLALVAVSSLTIIYWTVFEYKFGQSVGKMALNIYVASKTGILSPMQCFMRNISKISPFILIADCVYILLTRGRQRYLEKVSGTEVIERRWVM